MYLYTKSDQHAKDYNVDVKLGEIQFEPFT